jgi:hypothetical protein
MHGGPDGLCRPTATLSPDPKMQTENINAPNIDSLRPVMKSPPKGQQIDMLAYVAETGITMDLRNGAKD